MRKFLEIWRLMKDIVGNWIDNLHIIGPPDPAGILVIIKSVDSYNLMKLKEQVETEPVVTMDFNKFQGPVIVQHHALVFRARRPAVKDKLFRDLSCSSRTLDQ